MEKGRPIKLNEEIKNKIISAIRAGNYMETSAAYAGISKSSLYEWLKRGEREKQRIERNKRFKIRKSEEIFVDFSDAVEKALAEAEIRDVMRIERAAEVYWQAAAWRLERKFPDRWGRKIKTELSGPDGGPIEVSDAREKLIERLNDMTEKDE